MGGSGAPDNLLPGGWLPLPATAIQGAGFILNATIRGGGVGQGRLP